MQDISVATILGKNGWLQKHKAHSNFRPTQLQMAEAIDDAINNNEKFIVEAATGTGKTFAYLIPAILSGKKIIISTGTKNLQDQLFNNDFPELAKILKRSLNVALLKGRSNYLCKHRVDLHQHDNQFLSRQLVSELYKVKLWQNQTKQGDKAEIRFISETSEVWPLVTSNKDNCLGQDCDFFKSCFVLKARRQALAADVIVINHHLFFADLMVKEGGFGELLPEAEVVIFDEAHQLPEIASVFLGENLSSRRLLDFAKDTLTEIINSAIVDNDLQKRLQTIPTLVADFRLSLGTEMTRKPWAQICHKKAVVAACENLKTALEIITKALKALQNVNKGLASCYERIQEIKAIFNRVIATDSQNTIHWYETFTKAFILHTTPLEISDITKRLFSDDYAWIFTSATLTANKSFEFFQQRMGLETARTLQIDSHYDYLNQCQLYLPKNLPMPNASNYTNELVQKMLPIINHFQGRTFFLFTSFYALHQAARFLRNTIKFPILIQGEAPKSELIKKFIHYGNAILLGTSSFWEGVDVKGEALSCVIIDKLPFAAPSDPVLQARSNAMRQKGQDPFLEYQLPQAVIALKQGVGRLIRHENDNGLIVLADPRLQNKNYGKVFLQSLPKMGDFEPAF